MDGKDVIVLLGVAVSFLLGVGNIAYNLLVSRRTLYVNAVTVERVKWINALRDNLSAFVGLTYNFAASGKADTPEGNEMVREIDKLRVLIKLQLNPEERLGQQIMQKVDEIPQLTDSFYIKKLGTATSELVTLGQTLLKQEWDKVKKEAHAGIFDWVCTAK